MSGRAGNQVTGAATPPDFSPSESSRFTVDGDRELEWHIERLCAAAFDGVQKIVRRDRLQGLLLGGGYGRGEGGVLKTWRGDQPYNDLEFYVFLRGNRFLNRRTFDQALRNLGASLGATAGVDIDFHIASLAQLRGTKPSMFYYDLVAAHRRVSGASDLLKGCEHHLDARSLPLAEGTRLLMNRGTGLLLARERLAEAVCDTEAADFVGRNIAKAWLALGDAVLTAFGQYHWSCRERNKRLLVLPEAKKLPWFTAISELHAAGVEFKLHPRRSLGSTEFLMSEQIRLCELLSKVWLWIESWRLGKQFGSAREYVSDPVGKCPEASGLYNRLLNASIFGPADFFFGGERHPRERILNALAALLWDGNNPEARWETELRPPFGQSGSGTTMERYQRLWERVR